jgi:hypothetical protein
MNISVIALTLLVFLVTPARATFDCWSYKITFSSGCHSDMCGMRCSTGSGGHVHHGMSCDADIFSNSDWDIEVAGTCGSNFFLNLQEADKLLEEIVGEPIIIGEPIIVEGPIKADKPSNLRINDGN